MVRSITTRLVPAAVAVAMSVSLAGEAFAGPMPPPPARDGFASQIDAVKYVPKKKPVGRASRGGNPAAARRHWQEVVDHGAPALIEYGAASNELARLAS